VTPSAAATTAAAARARARAELAARGSYGRLLAVLAAPTRDIAGAEDALADAFERALRTWPEAGVPENPEAWLLTVARNRQRDELGSAARRTSAPLDVLENGGAGAASADVGPASSAGEQGAAGGSVAAGATISSGSAGAGAAISSGSAGPASVDPASIDLDAVPDKRLELLFVCAYPAIDPAVRTPLMLQTVLGFESAQIAAAFALPAPAMAQRLVRAKRRIRAAAIPFAVPERSAMAARLPPVLEAVYGCYAIDWQRVSGETLRDSLSGEALYLATLLAELLPTEPEVHGLAALLCLSLARTDARTGPAGEHVPLDEQDTTLWDTALIARGEAHLRRAHALAVAAAPQSAPRPELPLPSEPPQSVPRPGLPLPSEPPQSAPRPGLPPQSGPRPGPHGAIGGFGRFQLEAAMQSVHCARAVTGETDWRTLRTLNEALVRVAPTLGAQVSLAATIAEVDGPEAGLAHLDALAAAAAAAPAPAEPATPARTAAATPARGAPATPAATPATAEGGDSPEAAALARFQPAWATRAHLLAAAGRPAEARAAYAKAISLTTDARLRAHLEARAGV
jgi:RNA polymerase sigma-70 factor (ECF subfamily)